MMAAAAGEAPPNPKASKKGFREGEVVVGVVLEEGEPLIWDWRKSLRVVISLTSCLASS